MYGTIADLSVKPGKADALEQWAKDFESQRGSKIPGYVNTVTLVTDADSNRVLVVAIFDSKESYHANAADPAMDAWYRRMRDLLTADPIWADGEITSVKPVGMSR